MPHPACVLYLGLATDRSHAQGRHLLLLLYPSNTDELSKCLSVSERRNDNRVVKGGA